MMISLQNYYSWFLDYWEGNLSEAQLDELHAFLLQYPGLMKEIEEPVAKLIPDHKVKFPDKQLLLKQDLDNKVFFDEAVIASIEGDLSSEDKRKLEDYLSRYPEKTVEISNFAMTKFEPDQTIHFPYKSSLKKNATVRSLWFRISAAAAILIFFYIIFPEQKKIDLVVQPVAVISDEPIKNEVPVNMVRNKKNITITTPRSTSRIVKAEVIMNTRPKSEQEYELLNPIENVVLRTEAITSSLLTLQPLRLIQNNQYTPTSSREIDLLSPRDLLFTGFQLISKLSGERLKTSKNRNGKIKSIDYNSQLLAISIPIKSKL